MAGEGKKKKKKKNAKFWAPPPFGAPPFGPKIQHPKIGRSRNWPKSKLAEVEIGRSRSRSSQRPTPSHSGGAHARRDVLVGGAQIRSELEVIQARGSSWFVGHDHRSSQATVRSRRSRASIRQGRMIALQKPLGGVRGIVVGDVVRRLVARTMAQQHSARQWRQRLHLTSTPCHESWDRMCGSRSSSAHRD